MLSPGVGGAEGVVFLGMQHLDKSVNKMFEIII
jgi:hypothetical protein